MRAGSSIVGCCPEDALSRSVAEVAAGVAHSRILQPGVFLEHSAEHVRVHFDRSREILSSAVLGGGFVHCRQIVNIKVNEQAGESEDEPPQLTLERYCLQQGWDLHSVGMMTAASMNSLRVLQRVEEGVTLTVLVTVGVANARRAGDRAEWRHMYAEPQTQGTINTIIICSARLTPAAMVEALVVASEAKTVAMQQSGILSPVSGQMATGTGTDSIALVNGSGSTALAYCGKHVLFGECLARMVIDATCSSLDYEVSG